MQHKIKSNTEFFNQISAILLQGRDVILNVKGCSMLPFIVGDRDKVRLKRVDTINIGDIVLARINNSEYVLHRIIKLDGDGVTLMGDGNLQGDEYCTRQDVVATALEIIKPNKRIDTMRWSHQFAAKIWFKLLPIRKYLLSLYHRTNQ